MSKDLITSIGESWLIVLIICVFILIIIFRKELKMILTGKDFKIKMRDAEVEVKKSKNDSQNNTSEEVDISQEDDSSLMETEEMDINLEYEEEDKNWKDKLQIAFLDKDKESLDDLYKKMSEEKPESLEKTEDTAIYLYFSYFLGDLEALEKLKKLEKNNEYPKVEEYILRIIGFCYKKNNRLNKAKDYFEKAAEKSTDLLQKAKDMIFSSECVFELNNKKAYKKIMSLITNETDENILFIYYKSLASLYKKADEKELRVFALEKALEFKSEKSKIFNMAYGYSNLSEFNDLSLLHYDNLVSSDFEYNYALNNIGVIYGKLNLAGMKIDAYKKSIKKCNNTLSSANLAQDYINSGFYKEASDVLNKAMLEDNTHENVGYQLNRLRNLENNEEKRKEKIIKNAGIKQRFLRNYSKAYFNLIDKNIIIDGLWKFENEKELKIKQSGKIIQGFWYQGSKECKFNGEMFNRAASLEKYTKKFDFSSSAEKFKKDNQKGYLYISENEKTLFIMIINLDNVDKFFIKKLTRQ
ncbi:tetratricopeptide repeat protein [Halanaerobium praevalens]|uniref:TPR repeat-containing protein n=1 Tax=Halanaerobium praevalens (strain ATCC 33744 / DSM 2228 / GSL) TaxID=572479 RepID=E3DLH9_HALPG|nr:hypothetical protein [Halanaerobium praevalens]ADO77218.1 hypothetical protein Hprae_1066 [Halanaerobium praevalens DSM 2228]ADO77221.1 hypothetical protein Hprae_1069 [Halanaerobium praevalens DSM 2228]